MTRKYTESVPVAQPAAGAGSTYKVSGRWRERIVALSFQLATSAIVASREVAVLVADPDGNNVYIGTAGQAQPASSTISYGAADVAPSPAQAVNAYQTIPLPELELYPLWSVKISVANMDVGDQLSKIFLMVERRPNVEDMFEPGVLAEPHTEIGR